MASDKELGRSAMIYQIRMQAAEIIDAAVPVIDGSRRVDVSRKLIPPSCAQLRARQDAAYNGGASLVDRLDRLG